MTDRDLEPNYSIGKLAQRAGVPTSTVRYYERAGLIRSQGRTLGNYRVFGRPELVRLRFILAAKANGFTLEDVSALLDFRDGKTAPCRKVQGLIEERLLDLEARLRQLHHVQEVLHESLESCRGTEATGRCQVIDELAVVSSKRPARAPSPKETR